MDTHITTTPELDDHVDAPVSKSGAPLSKPVGLPGARQTMPDVDTDGLVADRGSTIPAETFIQQSREPLVTSSRLSRGYRTALLVTTTVVLLSAGLGAVGWSQRAHLATLPVAATVANLPSEIGALFAASPTTTAASSTQPMQEVGVTAASRPSSVIASGAVEPVSPARILKPQEIKAALEESEFASFKLVKDAAPTPADDSSPAQPTAVDPPSTLNAAVPVTSPALLAATPSSPGLTVTTPDPDHVAEVGAGKPVLAPSPLASAPAPAKPRDPADIAIELRAEPLSPKQVVKTAALISDLGAQLKDARYQVSQLNAAVAEMKEQLETRLVDFEGRLGLIEADGVLAQSAKAGAAAASTPASRMPVSGHPAGASGRAASTPVSAPVETHSTSAPKRTVRDFRIQGASPGMVVLSVLNPAPGEAPVLYLGIGDQVPGLGRVKAVQQRGTAWIAQTDAGLIQ